jgi:phage shock protein E
MRVPLIAAALVLALACQPAPPHAKSSISNAELAAELRKGAAPVILDVRSPEEYRAGHIPGSLNVPLDQLAARLPELKLAKSDEVVVHCERGPRAAQAEALLAKDGYEHVVDLEGHMKGWRESGLPVE